MASTYERLPSTVSWHDSFLQHKTAVTTAVDLMTKYDQTDNVQLENLATKVRELERFIGRAEAELESLKRPPLCGRSVQRCRRYALLAAKTLTLGTGLIMFFVDSGFTGKSEAALKVTGAILAGLSQVISDSTTICVSNSDETKSKKEADLESVVSDKSFLKLAQGVVIEAKQAFDQISDRGLESKRANRAIMKVNESICSLQRASTEGGEVERSLAPPSFLNYAQNLRDKLYPGSSGGATDFVIDMTQV